LLLALPGPYLPIFSPGVISSFGDIRSIITEQFDPSIPEDVPFSQRTDSRLVWRGQTSGPVCYAFDISQRVRADRYLKQYWSQQWPWKSSHRSRLHLLAQNKEGNRDLIMADPLDQDIMKTVDIPNRVLNAAFLDVGMTGPRLCSPFLAVGIG